MAVILSRSPLRFVRRNGLAPTPRASRPRLDFRALLVHRTPLTRAQLDPRRLLDAGGDPPVDRGATDQWPPAQEVRDE